MNIRQSQPQKIVIGIDLGSVTAKIVFLNEKREILESHYLRHRGHPGQVLLDLLEEMFTRFPIEQVSGIGLTGSGGKRIAKIIGGEFINEVIAETMAVSHLYDDVRSVINIGGQDSKLILVGKNGKSGEFIVENFTMNTLCAAGTGAFLDQQATRLGVNIEDEFGEMAMRSEKPPRIAGRCSVFAKSDMIHLQQKGTPLHDIVAGLCFAMARNFKATIGKNMPIEKNVAFIGGVARNKGMVRAFREVLNLSEDELIIPEHNSLIGALGAAFNVFEREMDLPNLEAIRTYLKQVVDVEEGFDPLKLREEHLVAKEETIRMPADGGKVRAFLGVDIGSISTNIVLINEEGQLLAKEYLRTGSQPIEAVKRGLREIGQDMGDLVEVAGACTTGSARYLIGDFVGADLVKDEITSHARGAREVDPGVDTIFEIGGQDSKYISLDDGAIVDFEMNKVCAAGTGSFLEEQAERLDIDIKQQFSDFALCANDPSKCGERCTVFMESDLVHHQQKGAPKEDIVAGLAYSIVYNYINKVVEGRRIGDNIFFQGGVAFNRAVTAAFETVLGKPVTVPANHEVMGAIGAALMARDNAREDGSTFKGWDAAEQDYELSTFECHSCANNCTINRVKLADGALFFYGSRCDKYDVKKDDDKKLNVPDYYTIREEILHNSYDRTLPEEKVRGRVGIPYSMMVYEDLPYWKALFTELGYEPVLSDPTNNRHINMGLETVVEETCFPIKVLHGHVLDLVQKEVDYIFLPYLMDMISDNPRVKETLLCTYIQTAPDILRTAFDLDSMGVTVLSPVFKPSVGLSFTLKELYKGLGRELDVSKREMSRALKVAEESLDRFRSALYREGQKALSELKDDEFAIAMISRAYNGPDRGINLDIPGKINSLGVKVIPMDFLPLSQADVQDELPNMFWYAGHRLLGAAKIIRDDPRLFPVYVTNFACGPDSFVLQYFRYMMGDKPSLILEVDEHSADAGIMTRAEAFVDSLTSSRRRHYNNIHDLPKGEPPDVVGKNLLRSGKKLYLPHLTDHVFSLAAALEANGLVTEVLPPTDDESLLWARKYTNNKECFPYIVMTGDVVKMAQRPDFDPDNSAFFMPAGNGVCRLNHYEAMQRIVLKQLGYPDVEVYAPSAEKAMIDMGRVNRRMPLESWTAIVATDCLFKALRETKPYEVNPGEAQAAYDRSRKMLIETIRKRGSVINTLKLARREFDSVKVDRSRIKPKIGIIGEFYLRWHPYSNNNIIDMIEEMGGEVVAPTVAENMLHFNHVVLVESSRKKRLGEWANMFISDSWQHFEEHRLYKPFEDYFQIYPEPGVQELEDLAEPYVDEIIENEIVISMGKARWLVESQGINGIINLIPFTCLLGTPIAAMLKSLKSDYPNTAVTTFKFDGAEDVNIRTRLEAFMHQARQYAFMEAGLDNEDSAPVQNPSETIRV
jgi:predicted CoA-substrate-specific enzyme activase